MSKPAHKSSSSDENQEKHSRSDYPSDPFDFDAFNVRLDVLSAQEQLASRCQRVLDEFEVCCSTRSIEAYERLRLALCNLTELFDEPGFDDLNQRLKDTARRLVGTKAYSVLSVGDELTFAEEFRSHFVAERIECPKEWSRFAVGVKRMRERLRDDESELEAEAKRGLTKSSGSPPAPTPPSFPSAAPRYSEAGEEGRPLSKPRRTRRGRPRKTDPKKDQQVHKAWIARPRGSTYEELGRDLRMTKDEVRQALDRHRHRQAGKKQSE